MPSIFEYVLEQEEPRSQPVIPPFKAGQAPASVFEAAKNVPEEDVTPEEKPSFLSEAGRHTGRVLARAGESALGFFGDLRDFSQFAGEWLGEKARSALGKPPLTDEQKQQIREELKPGKYNLIGRLNEALPTSKDVREGVTKRLTGEHLEPQSENEAIGDSFVQDAVTLFLPGPKGKAAFAKAMGISAGANLAHKGVKELGGSETQQEYAKAGTMLLLSLFGRNGFRGAQNHVNDLYQKAEKLLPPGATADATKLTKNLTDLRNKMTKGTVAPSEKFVIDEIDAVLGKVKNGQIPVDEAWASTRSINEKLQNIVFNTQEKAGKARARKLAKQINSDLNEVIADYGKTNPKFYKAFSEAQQGFGALGQSKTVSNFISKHAKTYAPHSAMGLLLTAVTSPATAAYTLATGVASAAALKTGELIYRIGKSPVLQKYYINVLKDAAIQDAVAMNKNLESLEKKLREDPETAALIKEIERMRDEK